MPPKKRTTNKPSNPTAEDQRTEAPAVTAPDLADEMEAATDYDAEQRAANGDQEEDQEAPAGVVPVDPHRKPLDPSCTVWDAFGNLQVGDRIDYWGGALLVTLIGRHTADHVHILVDGPMQEAEALRPSTEGTYRAPRDHVETARAVWPEAEGFEVAPHGWTFRVGAGYAFVTDAGQVAVSPQGTRSDAVKHAPQDDRV